jgi:hypothetical protein
MPPRAFPPAGMEPSRDGGSHTRRIPHEEEPSSISDDEYQGVLEFAIKENERALTEKLKNRAWYEMEIREAKLDPADIIEARKNLKEGEELPKRRQHLTPEDRLELDTWIEEVHTDIRRLRQRKIDLGKLQEDFSRGKKDTIWYHDEAPEVRHEIRKQDMRDVMRLAFSDSSITTKDIEKTPREVAAIAIATALNEEFLRECQPESAERYRKIIEDTIEKLPADQEGGVLTSLTWAVEQGYLRVQLRRGRIPLSAAELQEMPRLRRLWETLSQTLQPEGARTAAFQPGRRTDVAIKPDTLTHARPNPREMKDRLKNGDTLIVQGTVGTKTGTLTYEVMGVRDISYDGGDLHFKAKGFKRDGTTVNEELDCKLGIMGGILIRPRNGPKNPQREIYFTCNAYQVVHPR